MNSGSLVSEIEARLNFCLALALLKDWTRLGELKARIL
jgi:hypothetical protein